MTEDQRPDEDLSHEERVQAILKRAAERDAELLRRLSET